MAGDEARDYFLAVERHYQKRLGRPLILSPKDWEAVSGWYRQGVPLEAALRGLDAYLERLERDPRRRRRRIAVRYADNEVLDAAEDMRAARLGDRRGEGVEDRDRVQGLLTDLAGRLEAAARRGGVQAGSAPAGALLESAREVRELRTSFETGEKSAEEVETRLAELDARVLEDLREKAGVRVGRDLRREAEARLSDMRARMEDRAWERTVSLLEEKILRERFDVPRLSLYGF